MEAKASLIGTYRAVELHSIADIDLHLTLVVNPRHTESDDALGLYDALYDFSFLELRVLVIDIFDAVQNFANRLKVLSLAWMLLLQALHDFLNVHDMLVLSL